MYMSSKLPPNGLLPTTRETHNELVTYLTRTNEHKNLKVLDKDNKPVDNTTLSRKDELTGVAIEYLTSGADYLCTYCKDIANTSVESYYVFENLKWAKFLDIVTAGYKDQRRRAIMSIYHYMANPKAKVIRTDGEYSYYMQPFVIVAKVKNTAISEAMKRRLANLKDTDGDIEGLVDKIDIQLAKPLFEGFFKKLSSQYSMPTGLYAKIYNIYNMVENTVPPARKNDVRGISNVNNISAITRFIRYIILHNNFTKKDLQNPHFHCALKYDPIKVLKDVYPSLLFKKNRTNSKQYIKRYEYRIFVNSLATLSINIEGLPFYFHFSVADTINSLTTLSFTAYTNKDIAYIRHRQTLKDIDKILGPDEILGPM